MLTRDKVDVAGAGQRIRAAEKLARCDICDEFLIADLANCGLDPIKYRRSDLAVLRIDNRGFSMNCSMLGVTGLSFVRM